MFKRDHIAIGIAIGLTVSIGIYGIILGLDKYFGINHHMGMPVLKSGTLQIIAILCNLPLIQLTGKKGMEETSKGIIIAVMVLALIYAFDNLL